MWYIIIIITYLSDKRVLLAENSDLYSSNSFSEFLVIYFYRSFSFDCVTQVILKFSFRDFYLLFTLFFC